MTLSRLAFFLSRFARSLWFRPLLFAALAIGALGAAPLLEPFAPEALADRLTAEDLDRILGVLASSMLAVAVFSIGAMISALQAAAGAATPRARPLLTADRTAQVAISTFIGAFVFSVLGRVGVAFDLYGPAGRVVMLGLTLLLIVAMVFVLIAWIRRLSDMGGVREAIRLIEAAAARALRGAAAEPVLGGLEAGAVPPGAHPVLAERYGAVQMIDAPALQTLGEEIGADIHVALRVGAQTHPTRPLLHVAFDDEAADLTAETARRLRACFVIGLQRTFEHDPRFGLIAISEIASRALSPAINDPGTAIEAIDAQTRLLAVWAEAAQDRDAADGEGEGEPARPRLHAPSVGPQALLRDAFRASARDGAGTVEVAVRLQKALGALAAAAPERLGPPARAESAAAAARAAAALGHSVDREAVEAARRAAGLAA